jgi:hypothetical protein
MAWASSTNRPGRSAVSTIKRLAIDTLDNQGTIGGALAGPPSDAIYSTGSIGPITNSGKIIGNVEIDNQASVTVLTDYSSGSWTQGAITIGNGDLNFAGNTALGDNIVVNGGAGTAFNNAHLIVSTPLTVSGNFDQSAIGELDFGLGGLATAGYGSIDVTGMATLAGALGVDLQNGFELRIGDSFDLITSGGMLSGAFDALSLEGTQCSRASVDMWRCAIIGGVFFLDVSTVTGAPGSVDLSVVGIIPEPSTCAMLLIGFAGLGYAGYRRARAA